MSKWIEKQQSGAYAQSTLKSLKRSEKPSAVSQFLRSVRNIGVFDHGLLFDDEVIRAELDADDLRELEQISQHERSTWAQLLAHRLYRERTKGWQQEP